MKNFVAFIAIALVAFACSVGTRKDLVTGMAVSYNGFSIGETQLVNGENQITTSNEVSMNEKIAIVVNDVANYEEQEGRVFPVLDLLVTDKDGNVALEGNDILANEEGYLPADAAVLRGTITVGNPMRSGETYHAKMMVTDKLKPENVVTVEVDLVVK
jgi:hypothetical protein